MSSCSSSFICLARSSLPRSRYSFQCVTSFVLRTNSSSMWEIFNFISAEKKPDVETEQDEQEQKQDVGINSVSFHEKQLWNTSTHHLNLQLPSFQLPTSPSTCLRRLTLLRPFFVTSVFHTCWLVSAKVPGEPAVLPSAVCSEEFHWHVQQNPCTSDLCKGKYIPNAQQQQRCSCIFGDTLVCGKFAHVPFLFLGRASHPEHATRTVHPPVVFLWCLFWNEITFESINFLPKFRINC